MPPPGGLVTCSRPSSAATRSWSPIKPVPSSSLTPPDAGVSDLDPQRAAVHVDLDLGAIGSRVLDDVGQRLADHEIGGRFDGGGESLVGHLRGDRERACARRSSPLRPEPAAREDRRQDPVCQLAQLDLRLFRLGERLAHEFVRVLASRLERAYGPLERDDREYESLLRSVVQVALDTAPRVVGGGDDASARGGERGTALGVGDRGGDELREAGQARLGFGAQRDAAAAGDERAPETVFDEDRTADRGTQPQPAACLRERAGGVRVSVGADRTTGLQAPRPSTFLRPSGSATPTGTSSVFGSTATMTAAPSSWSRAIATLSAVNNARTSTATAAKISAGRTACATSVATRRSAACSSARRCSCSWLTSSELSMRLKARSSSPISSTPSSDNRTVRSPPASLPAAPATRRTGRTMTRER